MTDNEQLLLEMTVGIVSAVGPTVVHTVADVSNLTKEVYQTLSGLNVVAVEEPVETETEFTPAVTVRKSLANPDVIISMIDGKPYKTLRRHLSTHGLTPEQYRERYNLKADYPMVAPSYSESRRNLAMASGLGHKPGAEGADGTAGQVEAPTADQLAEPTKEEVAAEAQTANTVSASTAE